MTRYLNFAILLLTLFTVPAFGQDVTIETTKLSDNVYMLIGRGGNIGVSVGEDGIFVIDDQFANITDKIVAALRQLSDKPIVFLANTHHHGDHTGGNENMAQLGATIIAHDNVRKRLKESDKPSDALPVITYNDTMNLYLNGEQIIAFHVDNAHTDGDTLLYFTESNVLHTGDTFFKDRYPYIDLNSGGTVNGYIGAVKKALMLIDDNTKIIPGHGSMATKKDYETFLTMLETLKSNVITAIAKGKTEEEVANDSAITKEYDDLGYSWRFISSEKIRRTLYLSLKK